MVAESTISSQKQRERRSGIGVGNLPTFPTLIAMVLATR